MDGFLVPSTFSCLGLLTVRGWYYLGMMLAPGKLLEIQFNEPSSDLRCDVNNSIDKDFIRGMCFDQYQKQNNRLGLPLYAFITFNFLVIHVVAVFYSQIVKSTVRELESRHGQDAEQRRSCFLFCAYFCQLAISCGLRIISFTCLEREQFYPKMFPANFTCSIKNVSVHCFTQRGGEKNVWIETVKYANGFFALVAFLEILWILLRARKENWQFYVDHLKSNSGHPEHAEAQKDLPSAIQTLKEDYVRSTERLNDLKQPFRRPHHGEGYIHDLKMDDIYVNVAIREGRAHHYFAKDLDRREQLKKYPPNAKDCHFAKPEAVLG